MDVTLHILPRHIAKDVTYEEENVNPTQKWLKILNHPKNNLLTGNVTKGYMADYKDKLHRKTLQTISLQRQRDNSLQIIYQL